MWTPTYKRKGWTNSGDPLVNSLLWDVGTLVRRTLYTDQKNLCVVCVGARLVYKESKEDGIFQTLDVGSIRSVKEGFSSLTQVSS